MIDKQTLLAVITTATVLLGWSPAQATFSIVAVDTITGEVGGAGASCIANSDIINDLIESIGAAHTQAWWNSTNQTNLHNRLLAGWTPDSIIQWLNNNDAQGLSQLRQYGIVTLAGGGASASFTGSANTDWAGHRTGPGYAIQGNILLGPQIVDSIEFVYLTTSGPIEERLMAALEAAKVPGADTRCLGDGKSAISAFIKVVRPGDGGTPYLYEVVSNTVGSTDPIDVLRIQFDAWKALRQADPDSSMIAVSTLILEANGGDSSEIIVTPLNNLGQPPSEGVIAVTMSHSGSGSLNPAATDNGDGTFSSVIVAPSMPGTDTLAVLVVAGGQVTQLNSHPVLTYYQCGDTNSDTSGPDIVDLTFLVDWLFGGGDPPPIMEAADLDGSGGLPDVVDLTTLVEFLFGQGSTPTC